MPKEVPLEYLPDVPISTATKELAATSQPTGTTTQTSTNAITQTIIERIIEQPQIINQIVEVRDYPKNVELDDLKVGNQDLVIRATTRGLQVGDIEFDNSPFRVTMGGAVTCTNLTSTGGTIAGWTINAAYLAKDTGTDATSSGMAPSDYPFYAGATYANRSSAPYRVTPTGAVNASNVVISGTLSSTVFQYNVQSVVSGPQVWTNADKLDVSMTAADNSTLTIAGNTIFAVNDIIHIKNATDEEYLRVTDISAAPIYTVTRDLAGAYSSNNNPAWEKGTAISTEGSSDGVSTYSGGFLKALGYGTNSPYFSVFKRTGIAYNAVTEYSRLGNLNGFIDYATNEYGIAIGETNNYLKYDPTDGMRVRGKVTIGDVLELDPTSYGGFIRFKESGNDKVKMYWDVDDDDWAIYPTFSGYAWASVGVNSTNRLGLACPGNSSYIQQAFWSQKIRFNADETSDTYDFDIEPSKISLGRNYIDVG